MPKKATAESRPNVIWILSDQQPAHMLSIAGNPNLSTPHIDNLARNGLYLDHAVCGYPLCCPFRGSMLTSRYPFQCVPGHEYQLPPEQPTIADAFNDAGYHTAYIGKWHLDGFKEKDGRAAFHIVPPERRGRFQHWVGYENNNSQYDCWVHGGNDDSAFHHRLNGYETDELTSLLLEHLDSFTGQSERQQPFFAVLSVQPPHNPYVAPPEYMARHRPGQVQLRPNVPECDAATARETLAGAYAQVENYDDNIGRIVTWLQQHNLYDNTHIMIFSDHGDMHGSHGQCLKILPWEESIRVPFIISGMNPGYHFRRGRHSAPINHVDIAPTTLGLCGITPPDWMQGYNYSGLRMPGKHAETPMPDSAYLQNCQGRGESNKPWRGIVTNDGWKYVCFPGVSWLMFNLKEDPYEQANRAHESRFKPQRQRLIARLREWLAATGDSFDIPDD